MRFYLDSFKSPFVVTILHHVPLVVRIGDNLISSRRISRVDYGDHKDFRKL